MQPDTLLPNVYDPQKLNRYMFENGNPFATVDPTGHDGVYYSFDLGGGAGISGKRGTGQVAHFADGTVVYSNFDTAGLGVDLPNIGGTYTLGYTRSDNSEEFSGRSAQQGFSIGTSLFDVGFAYSFAEDNNRNRISGRDSFEITGSYGLSFPFALYGYSTATQAYRSHTGTYEDAVVNIVSFALNQILGFSFLSGSSGSSNYGGRSKGYSSSSGGYTSEDGRFYPTSNPDFVPNPDAERVCVSGC